MGLYVYSTLNTTKGELKTLKEIEEIHINTVRFTDQTTQMKSMLREVDDWIPIEQHEPNKEVIALGYQDEIIIGWISGNVCENDGEMLEEVTHWKPKPFTPSEVANVL
jgi:hypothetical protein